MRHMSSPSSSSSATAGRLRWTRPRRPRRSSLLRWCAAALVAAALNGLPVATLAALAGDGSWAIAAVVAAALVLVVYAVWRASALFVFGEVLLVALSLLAFGIVAVS